MLLNPVNEKLRNEIPKPPDVRDILKDILLKTKNIHASFLFAPVGELLLNRLALCLCSTNSLSTSGWQDLSHKLNLEPFLPRCIQNYKILPQDPLYHILVAYTQMEECTIGKVYEAIYDIQRYDVITYTESYVNEFYEAMCRKYVIPTEKILKPAKIPEVPVILKNEQNISPLRKIINYSEKIEDVKCRAAADAPRNDIIAADAPRKKYSYDKIVMLTYCTRDAELAKIIAKEFRQDRKGKRIGVIMLEEQRNEVCTERDNLVMKFITKANYIVPIVSSKYLTEISNKKIFNSNADNMDNEYVQFIYNVFVGNYIGQGCKNIKVRCIIPDEEYSKVKKHYAFQNPIFRTWVLFNEMNDFAEKMLLNKI